jgi:hypothetical protein
LRSAQELQLLYVDLTRKGCSGLAAYSDTQGS